MHAPFAESPEFRRLLAGVQDVDLTRISLEIARDAYPDLNPQPYLDTIESLAARVRERCTAGAGPRQILGQINEVLFVEEGFRGNTEAYYDPRNSFLNDVMDRKMGIPISLSVLYMALADRVGLAMSGVNLPAHFVVRTGAGDETIFVDPFHAGILLDRYGCEKRVSELAGEPIELDDAQVAPCSSAVVVARMLRNLKAIYIHENAFVSALAVLRRLAALSRDDPQERRDLGIACVHASCPGEAIDHLNAYLSNYPNAEDADTIRSLLRTARHESASRN